jgi:hypothetical protein
MNPWHDGWKLHRLKGSVMGHMLLRCLSQAITLVKSKLERVGPGSGSSDVASILGELRSTSLPQLSGLGEWSSAIELIVVGCRLDSFY